MKKIRRMLLIFILLIALIYISYITSLPESIILFKGENLNLTTIFGIYVSEDENNYKTVQTSTNLQNLDTVETKTVHVSFLNLINIKDIEVNTIPETTVIPLGNSVGLKLYTSGVLVVGMTGIDGKKPYENTGIEEGDIIVEINEEEITCTDELINYVNNSKGQELNIKYLRDGTEYTSNIEPIKTDKNEYKLGLWVRDGAAGIGTITYYEPKTRKFAALGHGIVDIDTEKLITISTGDIVTSRIASIVKGKEGAPGEIKGSIANGEKIGNIGLNTEFGIYGNITDISQLNISSYQEIEVATRDEIKTGEAKLLLNLEEGEKKEYTIQITKIYKNNNTNNKSMIIKVTDSKLLELTGGIVQRNEWSSNYTKRKIYRSSNTCASKRPNNRLCSIWRPNDKTSKRNRIIFSFLKYFRQT